MTLFLIALSRALDAITTRYAIEHMGATEQMPISAWLISQGWDVFLVAQLFCALWAVPMLMYTRWAYNAQDNRRIWLVVLAASWLPVVGNSIQIAVKHILGG